MNKILLYSLCLLILASCRKYDEGWKSPNPLILIDSPVNTQIYAGSQTANIFANIFDSHGLVKVQVHIYNNATGQQLIDINHILDDDKHYVLDEQFQVQVGMQYKIEIIATNKIKRKDTRTVTISVI